MTPGTKVQFQYNVHPGETFTVLECSCNGCQLGTCCLIDKPSDWIDKPTSHMGAEFLEEVRDESLTAKKISRSIAHHEAKLARIDASIKDLQALRYIEARSLEALQDSLTQEPTTSKNPPVEDEGQPFRGSQPVILEKRTLRGRS